MNLPTLPPSITEGPLAKLFQTIPLKLPGGFVFEPSYLQAGLVVILIFFLIYTLGHLRHTYVDWSVKGILPGLTFGFVLAIILEGLFLVGGKTLFTEILGWKDAPKPISNVLDAGRTKLVDVLGVSSQIPESAAANTPTIQSVRSEMENLTPSDQTKLLQAICKTK